MIKKFVTHIGDFHRHIELHRERVFQLGMTLGMERFKDLPLDKLEKFLRLHDASKTMTSKHALEQYNYQNHTSPLVRLFSFYGRAHDTEESSVLLRVAVNDINSIDYQVALEFFAHHIDLSAEMVQKFYMIEKVADLVDRSLDPVASEEFHQKLTPASQFIRDLKGAELSLWLEDRYSMITRELHMPRIDDYQKISG